MLKRPFQLILQPTTDLSTDPHRNLLVISTLDGTLTAVDRISGDLRWISKDDKPMIQVPIQGSLPKTPYFLPDPKTGSLYMMGKQNSLRKLPFTIPQLVAMAPCRNSEGLMYTGKKVRCKWGVVILSKIVNYAFAYTILANMKTFDSLNT